MSIAPGTIKLKDPSSEKNGQFDWDTHYLATGVQIVSPSVTVIGPDAALTIDNVALVTGNRRINYRVLGGTLGKMYQITCRIVTDEVPPQTDDRSILVRIAQL